MIKRILITIFIPLLLASCGQQTNIPMNTFDQMSDPAAGEPVAVLTTNKGVIKMKFFQTQAPETSKNFIELAKKGFFNGLTFHRVIPDFMIQGGDPKGDGTGGESYKGPGTTLPGEVSKDLHHIRGAVAMANKGGDPSTASSQFFIVQNKSGARFLDGGYTIFGQVIDGMNVVDEIALTPRDPNDKPKSHVIMEKVEIQ